MLKSKSNAYRIVAILAMAQFTLTLRLDAEEYLQPLPDAPAYQLSNLRTERDRFGRSILQFDFRRTRKGKGTVAIKGRSANGPLSVSAFVPSGDADTISLRSLFGNDAGNASIELFFVVPARIGSTSKSMLVSNSVRLGNPGAPVRARAWTQEEQRAHAEHARIMADDNAHKPRKSYPVSVVLPEGATFVPATAKLTKGVKLQACWNDNWSPLTALSENADGTVNVIWDKFSRDYDCSMSRGELVIENSALATLGKHAEGTFPETKPNIVGKNPIGGDPKAKAAMRRGTSGGLRMKSYPVTIAVPNDAVVVADDLKLRESVPLQACYGGRWNPVTALGENEDGTLKIRWNDYGAAFDCSMVRSELIISKQTLAKLKTDPGQDLGAPPLRRKDYAVSIPIPPDSAVVPANVVVPPKTKLRACWARKWNPITVLQEASDGTLNVHWDDFSDGFDCSMERSQLIIRKSDLKKLKAASAAKNGTAASEIRTWTDATGQHKIVAKLLTKTATSVTLRTAEGRDITLPINKLSAEDQKRLGTSNTENPFAN